MSDWPCRQDRHRRRRHRGWMAAAAIARTLGKAVDSR